ncbi:Glucan endo-1-6-beta-glucosidase B [Venturia nashicola]|uniref:Glucan endo-1-6-beta-glucosidase B n=1 Tax=Venturia nashicola TaxID=86259 RepID=A0A4Z1NCG4_9PEZI|nr:Glucan endo-1-6-beta-glucosidase B [Venturia nashicola]TLD15313.1 Glucan endo-1-6-beta-glucosidase B [Venturia nashicola]
MPRVLSHTPEWLIQPSPGYQLFAESEKTSRANGKYGAPASNGPLRKIARGRGTEVFVAYGNELRWADLQTLKNNFELEDDERQGASRIIKISGHGEITQLVTSPEKDYLAVVRSHTVHVFQIPNSNYLYNHDDSSLKVKSFQVGPTAHVLDEAPIVSVLWHPLGALGKCLVTITEESVLRLWEIDTDNRSSFDEPSTSFDLKKLANAVSAGQDLSDIRASKWGTSKGFTPDSVELEPAAACFGGRGEEGESPWRSMTLWIAMAGGDVYALCPLLPKRFQTIPGFLNTLSLSVSARALGIEAGTPITNGSSLSAQAEWLEELEDQEPFVPAGSSEIASSQVYSRPEHPGPAPKLQGPFAFLPEMDDDPDLADILVVGLESTDLEDDGLPPSTAASVVCLLTSEGGVQICLDLEGVEAQWLPTGTTPHSTPRKLLVPIEERQSVLPFEIIKFRNKSSSEGHPTFTPDPYSPYSFFVADSCGVHFISMTSWIREIQLCFTEIDEGASFRIRGIAQNSRSLVEHPIEFNENQHGARASCIVMPHDEEDSDLGYMLIASVGGEPWAAQFDLAEDQLVGYSPSSERTHEDTPKTLLLTHSREPYRADPAFARPSTLPRLLNSLPQHFARTLKGNVRLSEDNLKLLTHDVHPLIASETRNLNKAAAELFRQCERLRDDLHEQIERVREIKDKVDTLSGAYDDETELESYEGKCGADRLNERTDRAMARQKKIVERCEALKKKLAKAAARELSDKEKAWMVEVETLDEKLDNAEDIPLLKRLATVKALTSELKEQAEEAQSAPRSNGLGRSVVKVPDSYKKTRVNEVIALLEREEALVGAAMEKLGRLKIDG